MSLLKDLINESAAGGTTSAGAIAGVRGAIGGKASKKSKKNEHKVRSRLKPVGNLYALKFVSEGKQTFDPADVVAKMGAAEKKAEQGENTKTFALEDEEGNLVKVSVASEEADEFEDALARALHGDEDDDSTFSDEEASKPMEIAEILFRLKDRFTIVDVEWPEVEEDQEEDATDANAETMGDIEGGDEMPDGEMDAEMGDEDLEGEDGEMDAEGGEEYDQMSALSQVIDLLKAQADAQKAEADAKTAEAEADKAKSEAEASMAKVRQEEQILDMETYYKKKKDGDKEAKRLAQLAQWKHDMAADNDVADEITLTKSVSTEQEEDTNPVNIYDRNVDANKDDKLDPKDFIRYLFKYLRDK